MPDEQEGTVAVAEQSPEPDAPEGVVEAAETEVAPAAETAPDWKALIRDVAEPDLLADDRVKNLISRREEAARQAENRRLMLEAGSRENIRERWRRALLDTGIDAESVSQDVADRLYVLAEQNARHQTLQHSIRQTLEQFRQAGYQGEELATLESMLQTAGADQLEGFLQATFTGAVAQQVTEQVNAARAEMEKENKAWRENELKAMRLELQTPQEPAPDTPIGMAGGSGITPAQYAAATPEQRRQWRAEGAQVRIG